MLRVCALASAMLISASPSFAAEDHSDGWRVLRANDDGAAIAIAIGDETEHGAILSCVNDKLQALLATKAGDITEMIDKRTNRARPKRATLDIDGKASSQDDWVFLPALQVAQTRKSVTAKKLYNAAIRGDSFTWKLSGKPAVTFAFPEMNDTFKSFARNCSVTKSS